MSVKILNRNSCITLSLNIVLLVLVVFCGGAIADQLLNPVKGEVAPAIFWASDPVLLSDTVLVAGGNFGAGATVHCIRLPDGSMTGTSSNKTINSLLETAGEVPVFQAKDHSLKFILPSHSEIGLFGCRITNEKGLSTDIVLNQADPWWVQGDGGTFASPGGWIRVMGKCLAFIKGKTAGRLEGHGRVWQLIPEEGDCWNTLFMLPKDIPSGDYHIRVHNGFGGENGWSKPISVTISQKPKWSTKLFDVVERGADPTGRKDSTIAIKQALSAAQANGGGVVFFPRGRYMLSEGLTIPRFTIMKGESVILSCLFWRPGRDEPVGLQRPPVLIQGTNNFAVEDIALYSNFYRLGIAADLGDQPGAGNVFIRRVRARLNLYMGHLRPEEIDRRFRESLLFSKDGNDTVRVGGSNIEITDCDFYGSNRAFFLGRVRGGHIARNTFYNGRWGWYSISGSDGLIFEKNQIVGADLMSTGGGINCLDGSNYSQNVYFAQNTFKLMHGWDREVLTSDAGGGVYAGKAERVAGVDLVLIADPNWGNKDGKGLGMFILDGRGKGQYRQVVSCQGREIKVDRPWDILPDDTSHVSITALQRNYLIIGNNFEDATCAVQFYGTSINHIVAENRAWRAGGYHNFGLHYADGWQPSWFVQFIENEIIEGNQGFNGPLNQFPPLGSHIAALGMQYTPTKAPMNRFTVIRNNRLYSNARIEVDGATEDVLIDNNLIEKADIGISIGTPGANNDNGPQGVLVIRSRFNDVLKPIVDHTGGAVIKNGP